ncbi:hypothetical protein B0H10DRAFT_1810288, partial [Mycena sp. CBHHK59/15]
TKVPLPIFCPKEFRSIILQKFRTHFHQHPEIPMADKDGTLLTAEEIHDRATRDMYEFCFTNDLAQVWAYMWNRWYTPNAWVVPADEPWRGGQEAAGSGTRPLQRPHEPSKGVDMAQAMSTCQRHSHYRTCAELASKWPHQSLLDSVCPPLSTAALLSWIRCPPHLT